ncbi:MAG: acetate--CoA ligase family protein [Syntrophorhabdales bacterium]|jgi:acetyltransferase
MDHRAIEKLLFPESVVVYGVSDGPVNLGREIIRNLNRFAFTGRLYGVGRKAMEVEGRRVYVSLEDVPEVPELAVILVPALAVAGALEACGKKGVRHAVIETGGFSEFGAERKGLEDEVRRIARDYDMTCMGPNCIGVINMENGLCLPFVAFSPGEIEKGAHAFVSQSGGLIHEMVRRCLAEHVGLGKLASIGNSLMVDANDFLEFLIGDPATGPIGLYLEDVKNGRRLMDLASGTEKPVIVLKANTSPVSREIASFHTAALLGDEIVIDAAFRQAGIHRVATLQDMVDCFKIFSLPLLAGPNLVLISRSGGQAVVLADEAHKHGFVLPKLPPAFFNRIGEKAKAGVIRATNPIDLGDVFNDLFYLEVIGAALKEPSVDGVIFFYDYPFNETTVFDMAKGIEDLRRVSEKPLVLCMVPDRRDWFDLRYGSSGQWFSEPERAFAALKRSLAHYRNGVSGRRTTGDGATADAPAAMLGHGQPGIASTAGALSLMETYGVPLVPYELVTDLPGCIEAAHRMGYPVALKAAEPFIAHKTEAGAVRLNIGSDGELTDAFDAMAADVYLLQAMAASGVETIIGGKRDAEFGPVVMFGLGGIFVEVMNDVTLRVAPVDERAAREMIEEIKGAPLLSGARGAGRADTGSIARALVAVSRLLVDHPEVEGIDINPLRVFKEGKGCLALDVKIASPVRKE